MGRKFKKGLNRKKVKNKTKLNLNKPSIEQQNMKEWRENKKH